MSRKCTYISDIALKREIDMIKAMKISIEAEDRKPM